MTLHWAYIRGELHRRCHANARFEFRCDRCHKNMSSRGTAHHLQNVIPARALFARAIRRHLQLCSGTSFSVRCTAVDMRRRVAPTTPGASIMAISERNAIQCPLCAYRLPSANAIYHHVWFGHLAIERENILTYRHKHPMYQATFHCGMCAYSCISGSSMERHLSKDVSVRIVKVFRIQIRSWRELFTRCSSRKRKAGCTARGSISPA